MISYPFNFAADDARRGTWTACILLGRTEVAAPTYMRSAATRSIPNMRLTSRTSATWLAVSTCGQSQCARPHRESRGHRVRRVAKARPPRRHPPRRRGPLDGLAVPLSESDLVIVCRQSSLSILYHDFPAVSQSTAPCVTIQAFSCASPKCSPLTDGHCDNSVNEATEETVQSPYCNRREEKPYLLAKYQLACHNV